MNVPLKPNNPPNGALARKFVLIMERLGYIPKTGHNSAQGYDFVTDADVLNRVRDNLVLQNVATVAGVTDIETIPYETANKKPQFLTTVKGYVEFIDGDTGESYIAEGVGQGADSGDKGVYKAITGLMKYVLLKTFLVPTGDDPERDDTKPAGSSPGASAAEGSEGTAPSVSGLNAAQKAKLAIAYREAGLEGAHRTAFQFATVGKYKTDQMVNADLDKLLTALKDEAYVAGIIQDFQA